MIITVLVENLTCYSLVIPAEAGIQTSQCSLDYRFHGNDKGANRHIKHLLGDITA
jgi:hypothetical protein